MRTKRTRYVVVCVGILLAMILLQGIATPVDAADVKGLLKEVNKELRQAQRDMFGGKTEKAIASLENIKVKLFEAKEADPNNPQIKSYEGKYKKLVKDLERRTGKDLGGGSLTAASSSTKTHLPSKPEAKPMEKKAAAEPAGESGGSVAAKLPHNARRPTQNAQRDLQRIDSSMERLGNPKWNQDQLVENMKKSLNRARNNLETAREEASKKGVTSHPDFDTIEADIQAAEQKIAEAEKGVAQAKEAATASAAEVTADVEALKATYDRFLPVFQKATGNVAYYNNLKDVEGLVVQIENFEKNDLVQVQEQMSVFANKYGTTEVEIDKKTDAMGYVNNYYRASFPYIEIKEGIENVAKTRTVMADDLIRRAEEMKMRTTKGIHDFARLEQHDRIRAWGKMAARFDPGNPRVKAFNDGVDAWVKADAKALYAKIDKATFPKQASDAPKNAKELAREAKAFLQKEEEKLAAQKGKEASKVLKVVVTGPWRVFKKNILGEPIQYNLPIATAVQTESEKKKDLARVYLSTMLTQEMKGVKKAPPYLGATVGNSYYIRPSAVK